MTLLDRLKKLFPTAKTTTLKRMVEEGRVTVDGVAATKLKQAVGEGAKVAVAGKAPAAVSAEAAAFPPALKLVHEDEDVLVICKPAGILTSTTPGEKRPTVAAMLRDYLDAGGQRPSRGQGPVRGPRPRLGIIHRLDRDASGLLVFSKNHAAFEHLKRQFFEHSVERIYLALVEGEPDAPAGRIESHLVEHADGSVHTTRIHSKGQEAVTDYETVERRGGKAGQPRRSLLRVTLQTGRKHQIRAHLSELGVPVVNDPIYGVEEARRKRAGPLMLCAVRLAFTHPRTGRRLAFEVPPPPGMA